MGHLDTGVTTRNIVANDANLSDLNVDSFGYTECSKF